MLWNSWLSSLRARVSGSHRRSLRPRRKATVSRPHLGVEALETRLVPTSSASLSGGVLTLYDQAAANATVSTPAAGKLQVTLSGDTFAANTTPAPGITGYGTNTLTINTPLNGFYLQTGGSINVKPGTTVATAGSITLIGKGNAASPIGVAVNGATLNAPVISLTGTGYNGPANFNEGVLLSASHLTAPAGSVSINGHGAGTGSNEYGVTAAGGSTVTTTGFGQIAIQGYGSTTGQNACFGVNLTDAGTLLSMQTGRLTVTGIGSGSGSWDYGIGVQSGARLATNGGSVSLTGTAITTGSGTMNDGIFFSAGQVSTSGGNLSLEGTAGGGTGNGDTGVALYTASQVNAGSGTVVIGGGGAGTGSNDYGVTVAGGSHVTATGSGSIFLQGNGSSTGQNANFGVNLTDASTLVSTQAGALDVYGTGGGTGSWDYGIGVQSGARVQSGTGAVTLEGTTMTSSPTTIKSTGTMDDGVFFSAGQVITGGGSVTLQGTAGYGSGSLDTGVALYTASEVYAGGGNVDVEGTGGGGQGSYAYGVTLAGGSEVLTSSAGTVTVNGHGGGLGDANFGVNITGANTLVSTAAGNLTVRGTSGGAGWGGSGSWNYGVGVQSGAKLQSNSGSVGVFGTSTTNGSGAMNDGIHVEGGQVQTGGSNILLTGKGGDGLTPYGIGVDVVPGSPLNANGGLVLSVSSQLNGGNAVVIRLDGGPAPAGTVEYERGPFAGLTTDFALLGNGTLEELTAAGWKTVAQGVHSFAVGHFAGQDTLFMLDNFGDLLSETSPGAPQTVTTGVQEVGVGSANGNDYLVIEGTDGSIKYKSDRYPQYGWRLLPTVGPVSQPGFILEGGNGVLDLYWTDQAGNHLATATGSLQFGQQY